MLRPLSAFLVVSLVTGCSSQQDSAPNVSSAQSSESTSIRVVPASEVEWEALNPARGAMSPRAGTLWGDRNAEVPTGFLAEFADGFSSPPHIHNVTYRAVVIDGGIHNDDPEAESMWMGRGSFWKQPKGETHITAARGARNVALVEIDTGPYLVKPPSESFDSGERPVNLDTSNIVWLQFSQQFENVYVSYLWGQYEEGRWSGSFLKLSPGFVGTISAPGSVFHGVVIQGNLKHGSGEGTTLTPGSYFGAEGASVHEVSSITEQDTVIYIRTNGQFWINGGS